MLGLAAQVLAAPPAVPPPTGPAGLLAPVHASLGPFAAFFNPLIALAVGVVWAVSFLYAMGRLLLTLPRIQAARQQGQVWHEQLGNQDAIAAVLGIVATILALPFLRVLLSYTKSSYDPTTGVTMSLGPFSSVISPVAALGLSVLEVGGIIWCAVRIIHAVSRIRFARQNGAPIWEDGATQDVFTAIIALVLVVAAVPLVSALSASGAL